MQFDASQLFEKIKADIAVQLDLQGAYENGISATINSVQSLGSYVRSFPKEYQSISDDLRRFIENNKEAIGDTPRPDILPHLKEISYIAKESLADTDQAPPREREETIQQAFNKVKKYVTCFIKTEEQSRGIEKDIRHLAMLIEKECVPFDPDFVESIISYAEGIEERLIYADRLDLMKNLHKVVLNAVDHYPERKRALIKSKIEQALEERNENGGFINKDIRAGKFAFIQAYARQSSGALDQEDFDKLIDMATGAYNFFVRRGDAVAQQDLFFTINVLVDPYKAHNLMQPAPCHPYSNMEEVPKDKRFTCINLVTKEHAGQIQSAFLRSNRSYVRDSIEGAKNTILQQRPRLKNAFSTGPVREGRIQGVIECFRAMF